MRTAGLAGLCACLAPRTATPQAGAAPDAPRAVEPSRSQAPNPSPPQSQSQDAKRIAMARQWIATLLPALAAAGRDEARAALKGCSQSHYDMLAMGATVERFRGRMDEFLDFLRKDWDWIIRYDRGRGLIEVDENKSACVCPLVAKDHGPDLGALCYCSEGFAERLFSAVSGSPARAEVVESILRGQKSCKYRIEIGPSRP